MLKRTGFTLIEVVVVLVILVLIASLGIPKLQETLTQRQLKYSADQIRAAWLDARVQAMNEEQILCLRYKLGSSTFVFDRILDAHFTAGLSSRQTTRRFDSSGELDPFEKGNFSGEAEDFILRDPESAGADRGATIIQLPAAVVLTDAIASADERTAYYLGLTMPGDSEADEVYAESDAAAFNEIRLGETPADDGNVWSTPIFFYPDGTTSTSAVLIKNTQGRCFELRLRGLTGTGTVMDISTVNAYSGELNPERF